MTYEHFVAVLEMISSVLTYVTLTLLAVVVLLIALPRLAGHLLIRVADDPAMQHGLAVIRQVVHDGVTWLMHGLISLLMTALHGLITLYTAMPSQRADTRYVTQTTTPDGPSAPSPDGPSGALPSQTAIRQTEPTDPDTPLLFDIIARVRHEQSKESVMIFLLAVGWSVERIRSTLKGDTNALTQQIAACSATLREMRTARLIDAQHRLLRVQERKEATDDERVVRER